MSSQLIASPRQGLNQRQAETVERLFAAGCEVLREQGHAALTIRTVAQRAGVSAATAYTYLASKHHLFAELFWRHLQSQATQSQATQSGLHRSHGEARARIDAAVREITGWIAAEPELAAAVTPALLGSDPDVDRLRLVIGAEFVQHFDRALSATGTPSDPDVLDALVLAFSGALLQAGMGIFSYAEMADRVAGAFAAIVGDLP